MRIRQGDGRSCAICLRGGPGCQMLVNEAGAGNADVQLISSSSVIVNYILYMWFSHRRGHQMCGRLAQNVGCFDLGRPVRRIQGGNPYLCGKQVFIEVAASRYLFSTCFITSVECITLHSFPSKGGFA
jgi:hypothetical protein